MFLSRERPEALYSRQVCFLAPAQGWSHAWNHVQKSHYAASVGLELSISQPQPPEELGL